MPGVHKPDCRCPICVRKRKVAELNKANGIEEPIDITEIPEYIRLVEDYEQALEQIRDFQKKMDLVQQTLDKADVQKAESEVLLRRIRKQRNSMTIRQAKAVDLLRSASIVYHRSQGHRIQYENCPDIICRGAVELWFTLGELPGLEVATNNPDLWWDKKENNESIVANFADPEELGELEPEDIEEAMEEEEEEEEILPEPEGQVVDPSTLDEVPDSPAFAGKKVRILVPSDHDRDDPGMPKKARI